MAIQTSIARHFAVRLIVMTFVMFVLGMWGVWDYFYTIPAKQQRFERFQVMQLTQTALQPDLEADEQARATTTATDAVDAELLKLVNHHAAKLGQEPFPADNLQWHGLMAAFVLGNVEQPPEAQDPKLQAVVQRFQSVADSVRAAGDDGWLTALLLLDQGLRTPRPAGQTLTGVPLKAYEFSTAQINEIAPDGSVPVQPSTFDHVMQLAYVSLLLCVPYFLWIYFATARQVYRLDDDGTLHSPLGTWPREDIASIDMDKWMAKSMAWVVHKDGTRLQLDDYKFRNMHLIVGALAHRFDPEEWTPEAKLARKEAEPAEGEADQEMVNEVLDGQERA